MDKNSLERQPLYNRELVSKKIVLPFSKLSPSLETEFLEYASKHFVGKCAKEGYISRDNVKVVNYSAPKALSSNASFDVVFEFDIYNPSEGQELYAKVSNITKIGIKAAITFNEDKNPITVFASRLHNGHVLMKDDNVNMDEIAADKTENMMVYGEGDIIKIRVIGHRFEVNDKSVYVLGEIIKE